MLALRNTLAYFVNETQKMFYKNDPSMIVGHWQNFENEFWKDKKTMLKNQIFDLAESKVVEWIDGINVGEYSSVKILTLRNVFDQK